MIKIIRSQKELDQLRTQVSSQIGFVPTMGNLHQGHLSLLKRSLDENELSIFSIFVNPTQFAPHEDFNQYPRTLQNDVNLIESITPTKREVWIFAPEKNEDIYPEGSTTSIRNSSLGSILEGAIRPHHFEGVLSVVYQLFKIIRPHQAYFGLKDYQQYILIKKMNQDLRLGIHIHGCPIIRNENGLALSSRNQYLKDDETIHALHLTQTLKKLKSMIEKNDLEQFKIEREKILTDKRWNYLELRDAQTLSEHFTSKEVVLLGVLQIGLTRLLDNEVISL
jgi:pantoate--beta-alanine ligase